jgi:hypothetical protein
MAAPFSLFSLAFSWSKLAKYLGSRMFNLMHFALFLRFLI